MSQNRVVAQSSDQSSDLAGEHSPSQSEGLRPDTRTSNSEDCDAANRINPPETNAAVKGGGAQVRSPTTWARIQLHGNRYCSHKSPVFSIV